MERDLASLIRAKAAVFAAYARCWARWALVRTPSTGHRLRQFRPLPESAAALGIGLLPSLPLGRYGYVDNGSLEGAALGLLSARIFAEIAAI